MSSDIKTYFFFQAEDGIRDGRVTGVQTCALPISAERIADHAIDFEFARRIEDVLRRRTTLWLAADRGRVPARLIAERMAQRLGWSAERTREEIAQWDGGRYEDDALLERARQAG